MDSHSFSFSHFRFCVHFNLLKTLKHQRVEKFLEGSFQNLCQGFQPAFPYLIKSTQVSTFKEVSARHTAHRLEAAALQSGRSDS